MSSEEGHILIKLCHFASYCTYLDRSPEEDYIPVKLCQFATDSTCRLYTQFFSSFRIIVAQKLKLFPPVASRSHLSFLRRPPDNCLIGPDRQMTFFGALSHPAHFCLSTYFSNMQLYGCFPTNSGSSHRLKKLSTEFHNIISSGEELPWPELEGEW